MSTNNSETPEAKLISSRLWKQNNSQRNKELNAARNAAIRADPIAWAKKLESNRKSAKKNRDKRREYDRNRNPEKKRARTLVRN